MQREDIQQFAERVARRLIKEARQRDHTALDYESAGLRIAASLVREEATPHVVDEAQP